MHEKNGVKYSLVVLPNVVISQKGGAIEYVYVNMSIMAETQDNRLDQVSLKSVSLVGTSRSSTIKPYIDEWENGFTEKTNDWWYWTSMFMVSGDDAMDLINQGAISSDGLSFSFDFSNGESLIMSTDKNLKEFFYQTSQYISDNKDGNIHAKDYVPEGAYRRY